MIKLKGRKGRPGLGIYMESESQRGRWKEPSSLDRNSKTFLSFLVCFDFAFDILDYSSSADSLVSSEVTGNQEVRL